MNLDTEALRQVFDALDNGKRGFITVEQFTDALEKFYTSMKENNSDEVDDNMDGSAHPRVSRMHSMDMSSIVNALDPTKDGIISFEDFKSAFQNFFNCQDREELKGRTMTVNVHGKRVSITPDDYMVLGSDIDPDLKTEDSGFLESGPTDYTPTRPTTLKYEEYRRPSYYRRTPVTSSARQSAQSFPENVGSPFSGSRSDLMMDDVDSNFEMLRNQMRQMEAKMESMNAQAAEGVEGVTGRLREENARLSASVSVLEERLRDIESRYKRDLESERTHLEALMSRSKRSYETEIENIRARCQKLENDLSDANLQLGKTRIELSSARAEAKRTTEALLDAQDRIGSLTEQLDKNKEAARRELQKALADRDNALQALKEVNHAVGNGPRMSISSDTVTRLSEMQQMIQRLKDDNKLLKKQLQDAQEESWMKNINEGKKFLLESNNTVDDELDHLTKEEVVDMLTQERHGNNQLRTYLNTLLEKVINTNPGLLEMKMNGN